MNSNSVNLDNRFEELVESYIDGSITEEHAKELLELIQNNETQRHEFAAQLQLSQLLAIKENRESFSVDEKIVDLLTASPAATAVKSPRAINWNRILVRVAALLMVVVGLSYVVQINFKGAVVTDNEYDLASGIVEEKQIAGKLELSSVPSSQEDSAKPASVDIRELKKDMDALIEKSMNGAVSSIPDKELKPVEAPDSSVPQKLNEIVSVKTPMILPHIYGNTRNVGNRVGRSAPVDGNEQSAAGYDYRSDDLKVDELTEREEKGAQQAKKVELGEEMVPLKIEVPKPQFAGTPKDIRSPNLERPRAMYEQQHSAVVPAKSRALTRPNIMPPIQPPNTSSGESYARIDENKFLSPSDNPLSTFSIDVDTASYSNMRRMLNNNQLPPADAIRIEEMINYFDYNYEGPGDEAPFSSSMALHACPWNAAHQLLRVGLQGRKMDEANRKPSNLVFLLDVSGSMSTPDKLPLLKTGMTMMVNALSENDRVAIVVYAGSTGLVLDSTSAADKRKIIQAIERLSAGGSTAGGAGIELAYQVCADNFIKGGVNRVILATDGDFNVGISSHDGLQSLIEQKRSTGIFLSVLGFGTGNLQDSKMELLANKGNGNYFYIDSEREAEKVLVKQLNATLETIAKDVKIQIEFNPEYIKSYRLIGYENRRLAARDFDDDKKDAGEIGSGHQVTALYEIVPVGAPDSHEGIPLKYAPKDATVAEPQSDEMLTLKLRYKAPDGDVSKLLTFPLNKDALQMGAGDESFRWAAAVAAFGQLMHGSQYAGGFSINDVNDLAVGAKGEDTFGYRAEFIRLMERAAALKGDQPATNDKGYPVWQYRN